LERKEIVSKLKPMLNTKRQWDAFCDFLDLSIQEQQRRLEQSDNVVVMHRAQGAIEALRKLKYLRDEAKD
jgi:predicted Rossmann-fold nucleotide-binding protein